MLSRSTCGISALSITMLLTPALAQQPSPWRDPSKHKVQFAEVDKGVRLEVLDWGGDGRAVVFLAGAGNSAHVFDDFAPKLARRWHVYAISRRGYGASTQPESGYEEPRLAEDIVRVLDALQIPAPVLAGHSMAGGEMTIIAREHPDRVSGLVYLDGLGDPRDWPGSDPEYRKLLLGLPAGMRQPPGDPTPEEAKSFSAYRAWRARTGKQPFPEAELRQTYETNPDGTKGASRSSRMVWDSIGKGQTRRNYVGIRVPVLALFEFPRLIGDPKRVSKYEPKDGEERAAIIAFDAATKAYVDRWIQNLMLGVSDVQFIDLPGAEHFVYLSRETEVLRAMEWFLARLP